MGIAVILSTRNLILVWFLFKITYAIIYVNMIFFYLKLYFPQILRVNTFVLSLLSGATLFDISSAFMVLPHFLHVLIEEISLFSIEAATVFWKLCLGYHLNVRRDAMENLINQTIESGKNSILSISNYLTSYGKILGKLFCL